MADMLVSNNFTTKKWESVTSASQNVADLISEGWLSVVKNVTEGNLGVNFTDPGTEKTTLLEPGTTILSNVWHPATEYAVYTSKCFFLLASKVFLKT
jgi:hypothetical protein